MMYVEEPRSLTSSNPVLSRQEFRREHGRKVVAGGAAGGVMSLRREGPRVPGGPEAMTGVLAQPAAALMTLNGVIARTALALAVVVLAAVLSWTLPPVDPADLGGSTGVAGGAALTAFVLALVQSRTRRPSPTLILCYAALQGVFLGIVSNTVSTQISAGVVVQTVLGTMAVFAAVLIAYRLRWIRVARRSRGFVGAGVLGLALLAMVDLLFSMSTHAGGLGFRSGGLGVGFGVLGVVLGASCLSLHFRQVEDGVTYGVAEEDSWWAVFGLTLTLVWLYVEAVRLLTLVREDEVF